jgi:hypothetical protein
MHTKNAKNSPTKRNKCTQQKNSLLDTQKNARKKYKNCKKCTQKMQKTHQKCKHRYIGSNRYIAGRWGSDIVLVRGFTILVIPDIIAIFWNRLQGLIHCGVEVTESSSN